MSANESGVQRFATVVIERFKELGLETDEEIKAAGGPSPSTMTKLRNAAKGKRMTYPRGDTRQAIERAARWPAGSTRAVWHSGKPLSEGGGFVSSLGNKADAGVTDDEVLRELRAMQHRIEELSQWMENRGQPGS